jgi:hypothetical protein
MIKIFKDNDRLLLQYTPERSDVAWVDHKLKTDGQVTLAVRTFTFKYQDLQANNLDDSQNDDTRTFLLGTLIDEYYKINFRILGLRHDLQLHKDMKLNYKTFTAYRDIPIFVKIDNLIDEPIIIGGNDENAIPVEEFEYLLKHFPTSTELNHYTNARITGILNDYFETMSDARQQLTSYLERKEKSLPAINEKARSSPQKVRSQLLAPYEYNKFKYIRDELGFMLKNVENYTEAQWQNSIVNFLLLIFPKYIAILEKLRIKDFSTNPQKVSDREIDIALVNAEGTLDVVEIKRPFARSILSLGKYRDNYIPKKELSGSIMQVEKYIFHLNKWGHEGENEILKKRQAELPLNFKINIVNPKGLIILGRDSDFSEQQQRLDFEIIRRKYTNILDILTYDDLLRRLDNIIDMLNPTKILP